MTAMSSNPRQAQPDLTLGTLSTRRSPRPATGHLAPQFLPPPAREQRLHATVWGRTGSDKPKLAQAIFLQHLNFGNGVGLIEPHHDLSHACLTYLVSRGFFERQEPYG